jgi:anti-sigma regulatory factor (Ser/Thr protein kinase)/serine/threonine protein phosphatase PrpC
MAAELRDTKWMEPVLLGVYKPADVLRAADSTSRFADSLGFSPAECEELALVITELATNVLKHATRGSLRLSRIEAPGRVGIQIESDDTGPGIPDLEQAITDGYSTVGSLGTGLGTVNRFVDELAACSRREPGLRLVCQRWIRPKTSGLHMVELVCGIATRSYRLLPENGDAFIIKQWERQALVGVIDGLGHGQFAQRAALTARQYIEHHYDQPLVSLFRGVGRACRTTRGVVMALARFDLDRQKLTLASIGDIEVRLIGNSERFNFVVKRGIVGLNAPNPVPSEHSWTSNSLLIMHSDGLRTKWAWDEFSDVARAAPPVIARRLLEGLGKLDDDATVVVVRNAVP